MKQPTCQNCNEEWTAKAITAMFGTDPHTLKQGTYIVFQCYRCGEVFIKMYEETK